MYSTDASAVCMFPLQHYCKSCEIYMDEKTLTHCLHGKFLQSADVTGTFSSPINLERIVPGESEDSSDGGKLGIKLILHDVSVHRNLIKKKLQKLK